VKRTSLYLIIGLIFFSNCKEEYDFPLKASDTSVLVVEGVLNANGPTTITLSRSMKIDENVQFKPVLQAQLTVEGKDNTTKSLTSAGAGNYIHPNLSLVVGNEYRLRIKANGEEFLSDWVTTKQTPPIDSVSWKRTTTGLEFFVSTHDPTNESRYYKWDYDETFQINSYFFANFKFLGGTTIVPLDPSESPYSCWKYDRSRNITIGSSAQLQSDVINLLPVFTIPDGSEKVSVRYSVLMKQSSITKAAYEYLALMKKNTESLGTIFDPQPSELRGNIYNVADRSEIVIGYVIASAISEKRIFVTSFEAGWGYNQICESVTVANKPDSIAKYTKNYLPYDADYSGPGVIDNYKMGSPQCVDCTKRGGSLAKPSYW
jgi:hypothetical protein